MPASLEDDVRRVTAEAIDVRECDLDALVAREVDACDTSHDFLLTLTLLVTRVGADDANDALALDDLALGADGFDGCSYLHDLFSRAAYRDSIEGRVSTQGPSFRDRDRVLEVCGHRAIFGHGRPVIVENLYLRGPGVYHGFDGDDKAGFHAFPAHLACPQVRDLRVLVHLPAGPVADELAHDRIAA